MYLYVCVCVCVCVQLVATGDVTLAWQAADAVGNLATERLAPELVAQGAIEEIVGLLQVCTHTHTYTHTHRPEVAHARVHARAPIRSTRMGKICFLCACVCVCTGVC